MGLLNIIEGIIGYIFCIHPDEKKESYKQKELKSEYKAESYPPYQQIKPKEKEVEWTDYARAERKLAYRPSDRRRTGREVKIAREFWKKDHKDNPEPYPIDLNYYYPTS